MTPYHPTFQMRSSGLARAGIGQSSWEGVNMGCHEKAPVHCPCSWVAALYGAPWMDNVLMPD